MRYIVTPGTIEQTPCNSSLSSEVIVVRRSNNSARTTTVKTIKKKYNAIGTQIPVIIDLGGRPTLEGIKNPARSASHALTQFLRPLSYFDLLPQAFKYKANNPALGRITVTPTSAIILLLGQNRLISSVSKIIASTQIGIAIQNARFHLVWLNQSPHQIELKISVNEGSDGNSIPRKFNITSQIIGFFFLYRLYAS